MVTVDFNIEFSTAHFEIEGYEGEFDEDGIIDLEVPCSCGGLATVSMTADNLAELVQEAKKFRDRRTAFRVRRDREQNRKSTEEPYNIYITRDGIHTEGPEM